MGRLREKNGGLVERWWREYFSGIENDKACRRISFIGWEKAVKGD